MNPLKSYKVIVEEEGFNTAVLEIDLIANEKEEKDLVVKLTKK